MREDPGFELVAEGVETLDRRWIGSHNPSDLYVLGKFIAKSGLTAVQAWCLASAPFRGHTQATLTTPTLPSQLNGAAIG